MRRAALLGVALAVLWIVPAQAQDGGAVCRFSRAEVGGGDQGLGGTGVGGDVLSRLVGIADDRGIGGTGIIAQDRGLGGTGVDGAGPEGTGVIGVVTGFASICVNGYEIEVDSNSVVTLEGLPATAADIRLGQVVEVEAYPVNGKLTAASVKVRLAVAGPVEAVAPDRSTITVAGQQVQVAGFGGSAEVPGLGIGAWVAVSGLRRPDDVVVGTSIVPLPGPGREVLIAGTVREAAGGGLRLGGLRLGGFAVSADQASAGDAVVVRGTLAADALAARAAVVETGAAFSARVRDVVVQAYLGNLDAAPARLGGLTVDLSRAAIEANVRAALAARAVQATGRVQAGGTVAVERVTVTPAPVDRARAIRLPERPQTAPVETPAIERERGAAAPATPATPERVQRAIEQRRDRVREEIQRRAQDREPARPIRPNAVRPERPIERPIERPVRPDPVRPDRPVRPGT